MDKPKWWELRKKRIQEAQEEVEDYSDDMADEDEEDVIEYGDAEDLRPKGVDSKEEDVEDITLQGNENSADDAIPDENTQNSSEVDDDFDGELDESSEEADDVSTISELDDDFQLEGGNGASADIAKGGVDDFDFNIEEHLMPASNDDVNPKTQDVITTNPPIGKDVQPPAVATPTVQENIAAPSAVSQNTQGTDTDMTVQKKQGTEQIKASETEDVLYDFELTTPIEKNNPPKKADDFDGELDESSEEADDVSTISELDDDFQLEGADDAIPDENTQNSSEVDDDFDFDNIDAIDAIIHNEETDKKNDSVKSTFSATKTDETLIQDKDSADPAVPKVAADESQVPDSDKKNSQEALGSDGAKGVAKPPLQDSTGTIDGDVKAMNVDLSGVELSTVTASGDWPSGLEESDDKDTENKPEGVLAKDAPPTIENVKDETNAASINKTTLQVDVDNDSSQEDDILDFDLEGDVVPSIDDDQDILDFDAQENETHTDAEFDDFNTESASVKLENESEDVSFDGNASNGDDDSPEHIFDDIDKVDDIAIGNEEQKDTVSNLEKKKPTGKEIAQMLSEPYDEEGGHQDAESGGFKSHTIHLHDYIIHHKAKVIVGACAAFFLLFLSYIMFIGVETKTLPSFDDDRIIIKRAESINIRYGFGEKISFHNGSMEFTLHNQSVIEVTGDFAISASIFAMLSKSMSQAHLNVKNAVIKVQQKNNEDSLQKLIMQMVDSGHGAFADIKLLNTRVNVFDDKGMQTDSFILQDIVFQKLPDRVIVEGIIKVGVHQMNIRYSYKADEDLNMPTDEKNFYFSVKSHVFEFIAEGTKRSYGTVQRESRIEGDMEFVIRNPAQLASILTRTETLSRYMTGLQQSSVKGKFEYSSLGNLLRVKEGKVNVLNSLGDFEVMTVDASRRYKITMSFDSLAIGQLKEYFQSLQFLFEKENAPQGEKYSSSDASDAIQLFSVIGASKIIDVDISAKQIANDDVTLFKNIQLNLALTREEVALNSLKMIIDNENTAVNATGKFVNLGKRNPHGAFDVSVAGMIDGKGVIKNMLHFFSGAKLRKDIVGKKMNLLFGVVFKKPSIIFHDISMDVEDVFSMEGMLQFTERFNDKFSNVYEFRDISFSDVDLSFFETAILKFKQGDTAFQRMIGMRKAYIEYLYRLQNVKLEKDAIDTATFMIKTGHGSVIAGVEAISEKYSFSGSMVADIGDQSPLLKASMSMENVTDFTALHKGIVAFFDKNYIFLPSLDKFNGTANIAIHNSVIFGEKIPYFFTRGHMVSGVMEFEEQKIVSDGVDSQFSGKISGKIDMMKNTPVFTASLAFVNLKTKEFQKVLPIDYEFEGSISGGGGFVFSGLSYTEFLNSLQMKAKFVLQKVKLPQLNLNFLAQHLLKTHGGASLFQFDKDYIESNFAQDAQTEANVVFSVAGGQKKFTIDSCNIKTAYTAGVCAGNLAIIANNQISFEAIAKFAVPALDINKDLKDIMKLYVSSKAKHVSDEDKMKKQSNISSDLSQIYQYINYRRATFGI